MEQAHASNAEHTVWAEKIIFTMHGLSGLKINHVLATLFVAACVLFTPAAGLWYCFERVHTVDKLLATRSCEGCNLARGSLAGASLSRAHLRNASLRRADLSVADLSRADLRQADLSGASLYRANLSGADLRGANVTGVHLLFADLSSATWVDGSPCPVLPKR